MTDIEEQRLLDLWKYQPAILKLVNHVCGPHRKHQREDLEAHCYAELTKRIGQFKGEASIWSWARQVLKGVTADWLNERKAEETLVAESNGADPNLRAATEKVLSISGDEAEVEDASVTPVKANKPEGAAPDADEDLTEWAQGHITFGEHDEGSPDKITMPDDERAELEDAGELPNAEEPEPESPEQIAEPAPVEVPPTMAKIYCFTCTTIRNVTHQSDRVEQVPPSRDGSKDGNYALQNKVSTFTLECTHRREIVKTLSRTRIRPSRATGKPRGRRPKLIGVTTL
jgi:DNA-directed RNA polymerase specialized sigma24 family protein